MRTLRSRDLGPASIALACALIGGPSRAQDYVVLSGVPAGDGYRAAAEALAKHRDATLLDFDPSDLAPLRDRLRTIAPRHVAIGLRPEQLDFALARAVLQLATELDDDPFVDFAYGYVTGRTPGDAKAMVEASIQADAAPRKVTRLAQVLGGMETSIAHRRMYQLRKSVLPLLYGFVKGGSEVGAEHDREFVATLLPQLAGASVVTFVGHGMPREVVGGPDFEDLDALRLDGAVVLNVAC